MIVLDYILYQSIALVPIFIVFTKNKNVTKFIVICVALFLCFGYMTGSDWRSYELMYEQYQLRDFSFLEFYEPLFYLLTSLCEYLGVSFWTFLIVSKLVCFFIITNVLKKVSGNLYGWSLAFIIPLSFIYLFIDNPLRNLIAITIYSYGLMYFFEKKYLIFILISLFAGLFHITVFPVLLLTFLMNVRIKSKYIVIVYLIFFSILTFSPTTLTKLVVNLFSNISFISSKIEYYFLQENEFSEGSRFSLGLIIKLISFFLIIYSRKKIEQFPLGKYIFNGAILYLFLYRVGLSISIFSRYQLYFSLFYSVACILCYYSFAIYSRGIYKAYIILTIVLSVHTNILSKPVFLPYSSYLPYLFTEKPSFYYRSNYNYINSPVK